MEAVEAARTRAQIEASEELDLKMYGDPRGLFSSLGGEPRVLDQLLPSSPPALPPGVQSLVRETGLTEGWLQPGLKAALPFSLTIE